MSLDASRIHWRSRRGFTVVEMLVTLAIIITLVGILVVGLSRASGAAQRAQTKFLMNSMAAGFAQFKGDHGYLPPVLGSLTDWGQSGTPNTYAGWSRDVISPPFCGNCPNLDNRQRWFSITTPAEYLLGYDNRTGDGYGIVGDITQTSPNVPGYLESPPLGYRAPGADGAWGAIINPRQQFSGLTGTYAARNPGNAGLPFVQNPGTGGSAANDIRVRGRIYGPYLELKDSNLLGGLRPDGTISRPEDDDYEIRPKVILDYWGTPIRYYRRAYGGLDPSADISRDMSLAEVFALRPWEFEVGETADALADATGDMATTPGLKAAEFALLSEGPNRRTTNDRRRDDQEYNVDTIVELGP
jgi:type II secretory pathway pseudopilin PulG